MGGNELCPTQQKYTHRIPFQIRTAPQRYISSMHQIISYSSMNDAIQEEFNHTGVRMDTPDTNPFVNVSDRTLTIRTRTAFLRMQIPDAWTLDSFMSMAERVEADALHLGLRMMQTTNQGGLDPILISAVLFLAHRELLQGNQEAAPQQQTQPVLTPVNPVNGYTCAICLGEQSEGDGLSWSVAQGCDNHAFHTACIEQWRRGTCPVCRSRYPGV